MDGGGGLLHFTPRHRTQESEPQNFPSTKSHTSHSQRRSIDSTCRPGVLNSWLIFSDSASPSFCFPSPLPIAIRQGDNPDSYTPVSIYHGCPPRRTDQKFDPDLLRICDDDGDRRCCIVLSGFSYCRGTVTNCIRGICIADRYQYSKEDKTEIADWVSRASKLQISDDAELKTVNAHLSSRTTVLGAKPSIADVALFSRLAPAVKDWNDERRTGTSGYHHIVRYVDFVQNAPLFGLKVPEELRVKIDPNTVVSKIPPIDPKAEKERKKKEKEAAAAAAAAAGTGAVATSEGAAKSGEQKPVKSKVMEKIAMFEEKVKDAVGAESKPTDTATASDTAPAAAAAPKEGKKKEKKEKQPKQQKAPAAAEKPLSPALIDLRVGHILKAERHPNADSLYVSTIAMGDPAGTDNTHEFEGQVCRTVCSGLNGLVPLEEMQGRKIVAVCNLKPVTMRGIKSAAMVLAASPRLAEGEVDNHAGPVELVDLPAEAKAGDRVYFEGWEGEPEGVLNPKKKIWESLQPGFTTTGDKEVAFDVAAVPALKESGKTGLGKLKTATGGCTVKTLTNATVR